LGKNQKLRFREDHLVNELCSILKSKKCPWGEVKILREFNYLRGKTDVIAIDSKNQIIAFEVKLHKWRKAAQQAYRNTGFAHISYVVLPIESVKTALKNISEFKRRSVGLCAIDSKSITILHPAVYQAPILPWLTKKAIATIKNG